MKRGGYPSHANFLFSACGIGNIAPPAEANGRFFLNYFGTECALSRLTGVPAQRARNSSAFQRVTRMRERESRYSRSTGELSTRVRRSLGRRQVHHVTTRYRTTSDFNAFVMQIYYAFRRHSHFTRQTDGGGFEPPVPFGTHAFQACTINHSVTHPEPVFLVL